MTKSAFNKKKTLVTQIVLKFKEETSYIWSIALYGAGEG
jgi:hypothetical protein